MELKKRKINQLGIVVKDFDRAVKYFEDVLGIGPMNILEQSPKPIKLHGKDATSQTKLGLYNVGGIQIELIDTLSGNNIYKEYLDAGHEGIQHVAEWVDDLDAELEYFTSKGAKIIQEGKTAGIRNAYLDLREEIGLIWELVEMRKPKRRKKKKEA